MAYSRSLWTVEQRLITDVRVHCESFRHSFFQTKISDWKLELPSIWHSGIWNYRRLQIEILVLFYKIVNKIACIKTGSILAPADSRTRVNHRFKFAHVRANSYLGMFIKNLKMIGYGIWIVHWKSLLIHNPMVYLDYTYNINQTRAKIHP